MNKSNKCYGKMIEKVYTLTEPRGIKNQKNGGYIL